MYRVKRIRRRLEAAAVVAGVDLGNTFAHGAKGVLMVDLLAGATLCGIAAWRLVDGQKDVPERDA